MEPPPPCLTGRQDRHLRTWGLSRREKTFNSEAVDRRAVRVASEWKGPHVPGNSGPHTVPGWSPGTALRLSLTVREQLVITPQEDGQRRGLWG